MNARLTRSVLLIVTLTAVAACSSKDPDRPTAADATWSTWPGTYTPSGSAVENPVTFVIKLQQNGGEGSVMYAPPGGTEQQVPLKKVDWDGSLLEYSWTPPGAEQLDSKLYKKSDVLLSGDCMDRAQAKAGTMSVKPPPGRLDRI
jgi:hypothetical protein